MAATRNVSMAGVALLALLAVASAEVYFEENFDDGVSVLDCPSIFRSQNYSACCKMVLQMILRELGGENERDPAVGGN